MSSPNSAYPDTPQTEQKPKRQEWPLWEVFIRPRDGLDHKHCGSLHAADADQVGTGDHTDGDPRAIDDG